MPEHSSAASCLVLAPANWDSKMDPYNFAGPMAGMEDDLPQRMAAPAFKYNFSQPEEKEQSSVDPAAIMKMLAMFGGA